ncbi:MAG: F0F1 ATP synthase subunit B [Ruminococcus sp.]|nr:F0F1 ATP synthase subunit B [Ruminococcus sp.]
MILAGKVTDFLTIDPTTILGTLLNTLILFLILKKFLFEKVNKVIENRKNEVAKTYADADEANRHALEMEAEYELKLAAAKEKSAEIVSDAAKKAQVRSDEIISEAKNEAKGIIDKAHNEIEREKKRAVNQIKDEITDIAFDVASKVVEKEINKDDNEKLIEDFINDVGEL